MKDGYIDFGEFIKKGKQNRKKDKKHKDDVLPDEIMRLLGPSLLFQNLQDADNERVVHLMTIAMVTIARRLGAKTLVMLGDFNDNDIAVMGSLQGSRDKHIYRHVKHYIDDYYRVNDDDDVDDDED